MHQQLDERARRKCDVETINRFLAGYTHMASSQKTSASRDEQGHTQQVLDVTSPAHTAQINTSPANRVRFIDLKPRNSEAPSTSHVEP